MARVNKSISVSITPEMEEFLNVRARELGLSRSAYLQQLIRADLGLPTDLKIIPKAAANAVDEKKRKAQ